MPERPGGGGRVDAARAAWLVWSRGLRARSGLSGPLSSSMTLSSLKRRRSPAGRRYGCKDCSEPASIYGMIGAQSGTLLSDTQDALWQDGRLWPRGASLVSWKLMALLSSSLVIWELKEVPLWSLGSSRRAVLIFWRLTTFRSHPLVDHDAPFCFFCRTRWSGRLQSTTPVLLVVNRNVLKSSVHAHVMRSLQSMSATNTVQTTL